MGHEGDRHFIAQPGSFLQPQGDGEYAYSFWSRCWSE